jgi:NAD(P)-dependent dehydrogenase (short-subunit alcohol dehydrogenase family)
MQSMRTVVVTGSASGLGAAFRTALEAEGATVIGVDLAGQEVTADLSTPEGRTALVAAVQGHTDHLDGVVACAGLGPHVTPHELIASVNYFGMVATLDGLLPLLRGGTEPAALAIASNSQGMLPEDEALMAAFVAGDEDAARARAAETDGTTVYANSKLAVSRWVRRQCDAWGQAGVRLNALAPGPVETPLLQGTRDDPVLGPHIDLLPIPLGRTAQPDEMAALGVALLGPTASIVHGSVLFADGGTDALLRPDHA